MKKHNLILFGVLAGILGLGSMGTFKAGSGHVEVVKDNVTLVKTNSSLKEENKKLVSENTQLKAATDSLISVGDSLKETVATLETTVDNYAVKIDEVSRTSRSLDHDDSKPYRIDVPIEEVPDSPN